jgi:hypothetical protein
MWVRFQNRVRAWEKETDDAIVAAKTRKTSLFMNCPGLYDISILDYRPSETGGSASP